MITLITSLIDDRHHTLDIIQDDNGTQFIETNYGTKYGIEPMNFGPHMAPIQGPDPFIDIPF